LAGPSRAATVVIAQPNEARLALLSRIVSATGHRAVALGACSPPEVVEATVEAPANALIVDMADVSLDELDAILQALEARRFPIQVVALTDGPATAEMACRVGADVALARPFHKVELIDALNGLVGLAEDRVESPDDTVAEETVEVRESVEDTGSVEDAVAPESPPEVEEPAVAEPLDAENPEDDFPDETDDGPDDGPDEEEPDAPYPPGAALDDSFTDILKMGRQV